MHNPYAPPETAVSVTSVTPRTENKSIPIVPALIGMFTYGSSSPYALVLCIEHYLRPNSLPMPWSIHVATVLAAFGTVAWFGLTILCTLPVLDLLAGKPASLNTPISLLTWLATIVFFIWMTWRIVRFHRQSTLP